MDFRFKNHSIERQQIINLNNLNGKLCQAKNQSASKYNSLQVTDYQGYIFEKWAKKCCFRSKNAIENYITH
ncbi:MAG: hypothetical protein DRR00_29490 [Candidatus Parabeggiatoa sp. nov. 3]|nr:MAG: hypothetical protein DRR00_29490 [Gammaproteobacteria bacterium]RKZ66560.1 MAG: hypothetical protein DRQ99_09390 [Gammaproteobacteria bacterium]